MPSEIIIKVLRSRPIKEYRHKNTKDVEKDVEVKSFSPTILKTTPQRRKSVAITSPPQIRRSNRLSKKGNVYFGGKKLDFDLYL